MKTSVKIGIALTLVMLFGITSANLELKKKYDAINKSDYFWKYAHREKLNFSNIKIDGQNRLDITILKQNDQDGIAFDEDLKKLINYEVINNTLKITFHKDMEKEKIENPRKSKYKMGISYINLKKIAINNGVAKIQMGSIDHIELKLTGNSFLRVQSLPKKLRKLDMTLENSSLIDFSETQLRTELSSLNATVLDSSKVNLTSFYPDKMVLSLDNEAKVQLNAHGWKVINTTNNTTLYTPKTMP